MRMKRALDLSIIMINYNNGVLTEQAIQSIYDSAPDLSFEIIVVDNSSDSSQMYDDPNKNGIMVTHVENKGFGNACNIGAKISRGKYILFLNNDTIMHKDTLDACVLYLQQDPRIGALGTRTLLKNGVLDHACKRGFPTPMSSLYYFCGLDKKYPDSKKYGAYRQTFIGEDSVSEVDSVAGSFLMMPRLVFDKLGGYDETFFMYGEDLDLCYRVKELRYSVIYYGEASITHLKGQSGLHTKSQVVVSHFYNAMLLFYQKHYLHKFNPLTTGLVYWGIKTKYALTLLKMKLGK
jgi:GT2 family glycosyltransferase